MSFGGGETYVRMDAIVSKALNRRQCMASNLHGCSVFAAVWPEDDEGNAYCVCACLGGGTIGGVGSAGPALLDSVVDAVNAAKEQQGGNDPSYMFLVYGEKGGEQQHEEGNAMVRQKIAAAGFGVELKNQPYKNVLVGGIRVLVWPNDGAKAISII